MEGTELDTSGRISDGEHVSDKDKDMVQIFPVPVLQLDDHEPSIQQSKQGGSSQFVINVIIKQEVGESPNDEDMDEGDDFIGGEIHPEPDVELCGTDRISLLEQDYVEVEPFRCANCCLLLTTKELERSQNFHEFLPLELCNIDSGDLIDVEFIDAISEIFKLQRACESYKKIYQRNDLYLCTGCSTILVQMYKLHHEFIMLAAQSNAFLASFINVKKSVSKVESKLSAPSARRKIKIRKTSANLVRTSSRIRSLPEEQRNSSPTSSENEVEHKNAPLMSDNPSDNWSDTSITSESCGKIKRNTKNNKKKKLQHCKQCNITFKFSIQLFNHFKSDAHKSRLLENKLDTDVSGKPLSIPSKKERPYATHYEKTTSTASSLESSSFTCTVPNCTKTFTRRKLLQRHISAHSNGGPGECDRCGKKFKTVGGLKIHYASHIRDDKKYSCKVCGKKFRKQDSLTLHEKTDHGGFKPHQCPQCDKSFRLKDKLKLHIMAIHEKRKPFPCSKCEKSFRTKYHLKIHDVSQHIQGGNTSIGCSQCKRKFPDREALEKHITIHEQDKPFVCEICGKGFQTAARLRLHEKSHQDVPSCLCPICGRSYKHIRDLRLHEIVHQDESTYRFGCGDCPRKFYRIDILRVHQSNEKHFSPETIGPTMSKVLPSKGPDLPTQGSMFDDEDDEDENETDTEIAPPPPPKIKKKLKTVKDSRIANFMSLEKEMKVHPHATVIYHPSSVLQLQLDQPNTLAPARKNNAATLISSPYSNSSTITQQRQNNNEASGSYFVTQRDRHPNILHHPTIQIQTMSSGAHSQIQFGNQTLFTSHPINMTNPSEATEQTGFDFINSFNLG